VAEYQYALRLLILLTTLMVGRRIFYQKLGYVSTGKLDTKKPDDNIMSTEQTRMNGKSSIQNPQREAPSAESGFGLKRCEVRPGAGKSILRVGADIRP
jgi:hypothetical protein